VGSESLHKRKKKQHKMAFMGRERGGGEEEGEPRPEKGGARHFGGNQKRGPQLN